MIAKRCFAEQGIRSLPGFPDLERRFPEIEWIDDFRALQLETLTREKQCLVLARKRGPWLKPFHCYLESSGTRYLSLDLAEGCAFDCVYCYLQTYLNHGATVLFVDIEGLEEELRNVGAGAWISTGLLTDSLLVEQAFPVLPRISGWIPAGTVLEARSKSGDVTPLADPAIARERVVVSWSLNPPGIARRYEHGAAPPNARLEAARKAVELGYRVGFHLDPVFYYDDWEVEYGRLVAQLLSFPQDRVAFLSFGLFRYMPDLGGAIRKRFPYHDILTGEFFADEDGKYHYFRAIRKEMHRVFAGWLKPWVNGVPVFWSMEPDRRIPGLAFGDTMPQPGQRGKE